MRWGEDYEGECDNSEGWGSGDGDDSGSALAKRPESYLSLGTDQQLKAQRENDLIYHAVLPSPGSLPSIETIVVASPIPICGTNKQLSVRGEVEKAELAGSEAQSALDAMAIQDRLRRLAEGQDQNYIPLRIP
ncbi:hypothetical protein BT96DRAFT_990933 [Gymnopus androsaceus JB14]|uniref:Uncharacterized protein n=1 Tax=Gymnopus androsaceus JB14 TaxID=1447944 RepID=A0A6A4HW70_9AGAR|nr:hypothetical protein BT96DRAFT_990933 [Gymnopus androsaceus JB14]